MDTTDNSLFQVMGAPEREAKSEPEKPKFDEKAQRAAAEQRLREAAKAAYSGTDASFEADWPAIRASIESARVTRQMESKSSLYNDF